VLQLADILRSISDEELRRLREGVAQYWRAFIWDEQAGGLAYNFTILALQRRCRCAPAAACASLLVCHSALQCCVVFHR
jgi:hypothetical protein